MTDAECDALLRGGGWKVADARDYLRDQPTFEFPPPASIAALREGSSIQAIFTVVDLADFSRDGLAPYDARGNPNLTRGHERMWCWVEKVNAETLDVVLSNEPYSCWTQLRPGARLTLRKVDVIAAVLSPPVSMKDEFALMARNGAPLRAMHVALQPLTRDDAPRIAPEQAEVCRRIGVKPQRPYALSGMLLSEGVKPDTAMLYGIRARPRREANRVDCGWIIWTGVPDMEEAKRLHKYQILHVEHLYERSPRAARYLALPPGWGFVLGPNGYEDLYEVPEALE